MCLACGDEVESRARHDYQSCSCGQIAVDGGLDCVRLAGDALETGAWIALHTFKEVPARPRPDWFAGTDEAWDTERSEQLPDPSESAAKIREAS